MQSDGRRRSLGDRRPPSSLAGGALCSAALLVFATCGGPTAPPDRIPVATDPTEAARAAPPPTASSTPTAISPSQMQALRQFLIDTGRSEISVCAYADPPSGVPADALMQAVTTAYIALRADLEITSISASSVSACPHRPYFLATGSVHPQNEGPGTPPPRPIVDRGSISRPMLFVVVTTPGEIRRIFGSLATRRGLEELTCSGGSCSEVTTATYLDPSSIADPVALRDLLVRGLGLAGR